MPPRYNAASFLDLWFKVYVGEGQLGAVVIQGQPGDPVAGHFQKNLGLAKPLKGTQVRVTAKVTNANILSASASITIRVFQRVPRGPDGRPTFSTNDPEFEIAPRQFTQVAAFGPDKVASFSTSVEIV